MKLSIIVPVYNEENTVQDVLNKLTDQKLPCAKEIIVVNDGSTDNTWKMIKDIKVQTKDFRILSHKLNQGKGEAIKTGIKAANGDYILIQDADLEYNPEEISKLVKPIMDNKENKSGLAIYGSRFMNKKVIISFPYFLGNRLLTFLTNILYQTKLTDMETGYKLLPAGFLKSIKLKCSHFDIEPEITIRLIKAKVPIIEVPISYKGRSHLAGKKLTIKDAFAAIKTLVIYKFIS